MHHEASPAPELPPDFIRERDAVSANLPRRVGAWTRADKPRVVTARNIFDYMDGAGELYIGYRFRQLDVHEYTAAGQDDIQVELYWMEAADDAFGLLSNDWGGEPVSLGATSSAANGTSLAPAQRALYGQGLLRMASDTLYARVMAFQANQASAAAVIDIGRAIAAGRRNPPPPRLVELLPVLVDPEYRPRSDRLCYFRSHLVLNSVYFLGTGNLLNLVDALRPLCDKGPQVDPRYLWNYCGLLAGRDPVAVEAVGLKIINGKRTELRGEPWPLSPPPLCVEAADKTYGLGVSNLAEIKIDRIGYEKDSLV